MQRLHLSQELQETALATLIKVKGEGWKLRGVDSKYKDSNRRLDHAYWVKDNRLLIRGAQDFSQVAERDEEDEEASALSAWGIKRLTSLGFHR